MHNIYYMRIYIHAILYDNITVGDSKYHRYFIGKIAAHQYRIRSEKCSLGSYNNLLAEFSTVYLYIFCKFTAVLIVYTTLTIL